VSSRYWQELCGTVVLLVSSPAARLGILAPRRWLGTRHDPREIARLTVRGSRSTLPARLRVVAPSGLFLLPFLTRTFAHALLRREFWMTCQCPLALLPARGYSIAADTSIIARKAPNV